MSSHRRRTLDQRARFRTVNGFNQLRSGFGVLAFDVQHLAADHAVDRASGLRNQSYNLHHRSGRSIEPGQHLVSTRL